MNKLLKLEGTFPAQLNVVKINSSHTCKKKKETMGNHLSLKLFQAFSRGKTF